MFQGRGGLHLFDEPLAAFVVADRILGEELQGDGSLETLINSFVAYAHAGVIDFLDDAVVLTENAVASFFRRHG